MDLVVKAVPPEVARPFRQRLLRPASPQRAATRPEDALPGARHFAAFLDGALVGAGSVHPEDAPFPQAGTGWSLRGMVVAPEHRGKGVGARVLDACAAHAAAWGADYLWCSARVAALSFYRRHGFRETGEGFDDPEAGPHVQMARRLGT